MSSQHQALSIDKVLAMAEVSSRREPCRLEEDGLVAAAKQGQAAAFDDLWKAHAKRVLQTTMRITRNREDAEDALQDSFLNAFVHIQDFDGGSSFSTWLTRIAINAALMTLRKRRSALELAIADLPYSAQGDERGEYGLMSVPDRAPDPEAYCLRREQKRLLRDAVRELRPAIRQALVLQTLQERTLRETAERMGLSVTATKSRLFHARAALRKSLAADAPDRARGTDQVAFLPAA